MLYVNDKITIPDAELQFTFARSPGPGGQNVNKVNTKAVLRWAIKESPSLPEPVRARFLTLFRTRVTGDGDVIITSTRYRDQPRNVQDCLDKLREMLVAATQRPKRRIPTKRSAGSNRRRLDSKKRNSQRKQNRRPPNDY